MSGPTAAQSNLQDQQAAFYQQATQEASTTYGEQQELLGKIRSIYDPILAKGPNARGFSAGEKADLDAGAVNQTASNYAGASKAVNENLAAEGGGNLALPTGAQTQLKAEVAASSADTESNEESQIDQADYAEGARQFGQATSAEENVSGQYNPLGYESNATSAGAAEGVTANQIAQESNSWQNAVIGAVGSIGGGLAGNPSIGNLFK